MTWLGWTWLCTCSPTDLHHRPGARELYIASPVLCIATTDTSATLWGPSAGEHALPGWNLNCHDKLSGPAC